MSYPVFNPNAPTINPNPGQDTLKIYQSIYAKSPDIRKILQGPAKTAQYLKSSFVSTKDKARTVTVITIGTGATTYVAGTTATSLAVKYGVVSSSLGGPAVGIIVGATAGTIAFLLLNMVDQTTDPRRQHKVRRNFIKELQEDKIISQFKCGYCKRGIHDTVFSLPKGELAHWACTQEASLDQNQFRLPDNSIGKLAEVTNDYLAQYIVSARVIQLTLNSLNQSPQRLANFAIPLLNELRRAEVSYVVAEKKLVSAHNKSTPQYRINIQPILFCYHIDGETMKKVAKLYDESIMQRGHGPREPKKSPKSDGIYLNHKPQKKWNCCVIV